MKYLTQTTYRPLHCDCSSFMARSKVSQFQLIETSHYKFLSRKSSCRYALRITPFSFRLSFTAGSHFGDSYNGRLVTHYIRANFHFRNLLQLIFYAIAKSQHTKMTMYGHGNDIILLLKLPLINCDGTAMIGAPYVCVFIPIFRRT